MKPACLDMTEALQNQDLPVTSPCTVINLIDGLVNDDTALDLNPWQKYERNDLIVKVVAQVQLSLARAFFKIFFCFCAINIHFVG